MQSFRRSSTKTYWMNNNIFSFNPHLHQACFVSNFMGKVADLTTLNEFLHCLYSFVHFPCLGRFLSATGYSKKWTALWNQIPSPLPTPIFTPLPYFSVIRVNMCVLKHWVFLEDIWNFSQWKSLIIDEEYWMLWKAMLRETIISPPQW